MASSSSSSSAAASSAMDRNDVPSAAQRRQTMPASSHHVASPPIFSQDGVLAGLASTAQQATGRLHLRLDVDGCLRELSKRRAGEVQGAASDSDENKKISRQANLSVAGASTSPMPLLAGRDCASVAPAAKRLKFVLEKQLTKSDVSTVGRIILPKKQAEAKLPFLEDKWGVTLTVRDVFSSHKWSMKYRYWPNHKSKMFVLENTDDFIKKNNLVPGDTIAIYQDDNKQNYICGKKIDRPRYPLELVAQEVERPDNKQVASRSNVHDLESRKHARYSHNIDILGSHPVAPIEDDWGQWDNGLDADDDMIGSSNRRLNQHGKFPSFDDCDLSLFDSRPEEDAADKSPDDKQE